MNRWYPRNLRGVRTEFMRKRWLKTELPKAAQHEEDVREARQARQASGDNVR